REERAAVVAARRPGQLADVATVAVHDVEFEVVLAAAVGAEDDVFAVRREAALGVVALGVGQPLQAAAVGVGLEDVHVRVEVPLVGPTLAGRLLLLARLVLLGVPVLGVRVEVAAGEDDLLAVGGEVGAGRLADAGADAAELAALQVHDEDLV